MFFSNSKPGYTNNVGYNFNKMLDNTVPFVRLYNPRLKKLVNLFQKRYINGNSMGFGDYIRGSLCLIQICQLHNLQFDMNYYNHPVSKFLTNTTENDQLNIQSNTINYNGVAMFTDNNFDRNNKTFHKKMIDLLNTIQTSHHYLFCNSYPIVNPTDTQRRIVASKIQPNEVLQEAIKNSMEKLGLQRGGYRVIHIRTGDRYLLNNAPLDKNLVSKVVQTINKNITKLSPHKYLILSDNNELKKVLSTIYDKEKFIIQINSITHLGEGAVKDDESVKNTLVDFFLMAQSNAIISMSPYFHETSFSKYCGILFGIPNIFNKLDIPL
jgi:hypothetical protein